MAVIKRQVVYIVSLLKPSSDRLAGLRGLEEVLERNSKNESASDTQSTLLPPSPSSPGERTDAEIENICLAAVRELLDNSTGKADQGSPTPSEAKAAGLLEAKLERVDKSLEELAVKLAFKGRSKIFSPSP